MNNSSGDDIPRAQNVKRMSSRMSRISDLPTSERARTRKKKEGGERRRARKKKGKGLFVEIGKYASTLAGSGVDDPEEKDKGGEEEKMSMLPGERTSEVDEPGISRLQRLLRGVVDESAAASTALRLPALGMEHDLVIRVALEDEWQLVSCASLPFTIVYFLIFMVFFQNHYSTANIFLAEHTLRRDIGYPAMELSDSMHIYDWLEESAIPYLWGPKMMDGEFNSNTPSLYQEVLAGLLFSTTRASAGPCEYEAANMDCFNLEISSEHGDAFGYESERLLQSVSTTSSDSVAPAEASSSTSAARSLRRADAERSSPQMRKPRQTRLSRPVRPSDDSIPSGSAVSSSRPGRRGARSLRRQREKGSGSLDDLGQKTSAVLRTFNQRLAQHMRDRRTARHKRLLREARSDPMSALPNGAGMELSAIVIPTSFTFSEMWQELRRWKDIRVINMRTVTFSLEALILNEHISVSFQSLTKLDIVFSVSRGGMLFVNVKLVTLMLNTNFQGFVSMLAGPMWIVCLVGFSCTLPGRATEKSKDGWCKCIAHFLRFWNLLEWVIILGGWVIVLMYIVERTQNNVCKRSLDEYRIEREGVPPEDWWQLDRDAFTDLNFKASNAALTSMWMQVVVANYHLILVFRFFMASRGQPRLAVVLSTIRKASTDLMHLFLVFLIILGAYVISGHLLFGRRMEEYSTISGSFADCIQIVTEREYNWDKFTQEDLYTATAWVWSFLCLVVLVLVNIFLAMIFDTYGEVRSAVGDSVSFWQTTKRFVRHLKMSIKPVSQEGRWVPNRELVSAVQKMHSGQVTPWMLKDAFPTISNKQVNHIFILAKNRHAQVLARSQRAGGLPETISRTLLSIEKLHIGMALMQEQHFPRSRKAASNPIIVTVEGAPARFGDAAETLQPAKTDSGLPPNKNDSGLTRLTSDSSVGFIRRVGTPAPAESPGWIQVQLQPHFRKQARALSQILAQIKRMEQDLHVHSIGDECPPVPGGPPISSARRPNATAAPWTNGEALAWPMRMNSPPPPADHVPAAVRLGLTREGLADEDFPPKESSQVLPCATRKLATEPNPTMRALVDLRPQNPSDVKGRQSGSGNLASYCACSSL